MPAITKSGNVLTKKPTKIEESNSVSFEYVINETTLLNKLKTVDGKGSGLDADLVRGDYINPRMFKNRIINGDFSIWQRGEEFTFESNSADATYSFGYTADRVTCGNMRTGGSFTVSKSSFNNMYSYKVTVNEPPDSLLADVENGRYWDPFYYIFEGQHLYDLAINGNPVTISFWWKSNVNGKISVVLRNTTPNPNGQGGYEAWVTSFTSIGNDQPQKVVITIPFKDTWLTLPQNNNIVGFKLVIGEIGDFYACDPGQENQWVNVNSNGVCPFCVSDYTNWAAQAGNYIEIAELQLEEGEVATEFEHVPYDIQLMRCMRYYEEGYISFDLPLGPNYTHDTKPGFSVFFKVPKRTTPSVQEKDVTITTGASGTWDDGGIGNVTADQYLSHVRALQDTTDYCNKRAKYVASAEL